MDTLKKITVVFVMLLSCGVTVMGQDVNYLQLAKEALNKQDCKKAQLWYDMYKEQTHRADTDIERQIQECLKPITGDNVPAPAPAPTPAVSDFIEMVHVAGGTFTMGCTSEQGKDCHDEEKPAHQVTLSDFYIGKYEVTQAQWKAVMGNNPSSFKGDNLPVENVSWDEVQDFLRKLNQKTGKAYRLPTEAEWEYAARGGAQGKGYKYSGSNTVGDVAWYPDNVNSKTHPVGTKQANELGIYDMSGNVLEWCSDWYGAYPAGSQTNPKGASSGSERVSRGVGLAYGVWDCRVSFRYGITPDYSYRRLGFRLACSSKHPLFLTGIRIFPR